MLPKENRLKKNKDFERIYKKGKGFKGEFLFLKIIENNLDLTRIGFVASKKVSKKAVIRNRIKRILREIVRKKLPEMKKGKDGIITIEPGLEKKEFSEIKIILDNLFKKAELLEKTKNND